MKKTLLSLLIAAAPCFLFAQLPSYLPTDGLVGWWPFNGNANDESGSGNDGTVTGAMLSMDRFGNSYSAYSFNGTTDEIAITNNLLTLVSDFTVSCWMNSSDIFKTQQCLFNSINHTGFVVELNNENIPPNKLMYGVGPANAFWNLIYAQGSYNLYQNNTWYHVIFEKTGTTYTLYVNNISDGSSVVSVSTNYTQSVGLRIGSIGGSEFFKGKLDDFGVWNRALTAQERTDLYNATPTNGGGGGSNTASTNVPQAISYQAVARDAQGQPLSDAAVQVKFTLLADSLNGTTEYSESHSLSTNSLGLFTTAFGSGTPLSGTFAGINWAAGNKYLKVELDAGSGFADMGTQQLLSVPYSMRSNTSAKAGTIENAGLPVYTDNAAALAGGLVAGQLYRTATGDLKIVY